MSSTMSSTYPVLFYDGQCGLCQRSVQFVLRHQKGTELYFAPLEGMTAQQLLPVRYREMNSLVLLLDADDEPLVRSQAAFRLCSFLKGAWRVPRILAFLPPWLFDWGYKWVAKNRYHLWDSDPSCLVPTTQQQKQFLD